MTALAVLFGGSKKYWHRQMCELFLLGEPFFNKHKDKWEREDPSTAFDNLDEIRFREYKKNVEDIWTEKGVDFNEIVEEYY